MHKNRYGMIKLLNGEIAFLRGELSRELWSNQKLIEVLLGQNPHYQTHQRNAMNFYTIIKNSLLVIKYVKINAHNLIH